MRLSAPIALAVLLSTASAAAADEAPDAFPAERRIARRRDVAVREEPGP